MVHRCILKRRRNEKATLNKAGALCYGSWQGSGSIEAVHIRPFLAKLGSPLGYDPSQYGSLMQMLAGIPAFTPIWDKSRRKYKLHYRNTLVSLVHFATLVDPAYEGPEHSYSKRWITFRVFHGMKTSGKSFKKTYGRGTIERT